MLLAASSQSPLGSVHPLQLQLLAKIRGLQYATLRAPPTRMANSGPVPVFKSKASDLTRSFPKDWPRLPRPLLPCIHCRSGPRFSSPRHTSFEGRRTSLSRTLKAGARFDQPAVPRCCPHFYPNNINKPPETRSRGQRRPPRSPGPDPGRFRLWPRLGAVGRGGCHTLQRKVAPKRCEYLGDATLGPSQDCMCSGPSGPVAVATERPGARRMALTSPGVDALARQEDPEASDLPQGGRYQGEVTCVSSSSAVPG